MVCVAAEAVETCGKVRDSRSQGQADKLSSRTVPAIIKYIALGFY